MTYDEFALRFTEFYNECKHFDPRELRERVYKNRLIAHYRLLRKHDVQDYDRVIAGYLQVDIKPEWPWPGIMLELVCGERDSREADERTKCREPPQGELCSREEIEEIERRLRTLQGGRERRTGRLSPKTW